MKSQTFMRLLSIIVIWSFLPYATAWGALQPPLNKITNPVFGTSGGTVPATVPSNLSPYIKDVPAAIRLGKALFWDMQVGSDGVTACASCHYRAGADPLVGTDPKLTAKRDTNQLHPGPDAIFGNNSTVIKTFDPLAVTPVNILLRATGFPSLNPNDPPGTSRFAPNYLLDTTVYPVVNTLVGDFPLFQVDLPFTRLVIDPLTGLATDAAKSVRDTNDVVGSQGVRLAQFAGIDPNANTALDLSTPITDTLFTIGGGVNIRQVTGRNAPSVINAVFNYTNFWDGRANNIFNGVSPFGPLDQAARIWVNTSVPETPGAQPVQQQIAIPNASLASQAVGPALSDVEMSFKGRTFPDLGRKMIVRAPLANQFVHTQDSVLGTLSRGSLQPDGTITGNRGINVRGNTYRSMIEDAFVNNLWDGASVNTPDGVFTQMEANFSLFWGLAIQLYEATLVSDRAPFDRFQAGNMNALNVGEQRGFSTFDGKCNICHTGSEFSSAVVGSNTPGCAAALANDITAIACNVAAFTNNSSHKLIKEDVNPETFTTPMLIDAGFFNIGVRPTADDPGRGGSKLGFPLSFSRLAVQAAQTGLPFVTPKLPVGFTQTDKVDGSFKTPGLRNVELTAPYFHNGDALTLDQVLEFYSRGGNFPNNPELASAMQPIKNLMNDAARRADIVAFLKKLTDERVRNEWAPFDHPEITIPNGVNAGADALITLPATGGGPAAVPPALFQINEPGTQTSLTSLVISGTVDDTATVEVSVNNLTSHVSLPPAAATVGGTVGGVAGGVAQAANAWSINLTGLLPGFNSITVNATSITGGPAAPITRVIQVLPTATISGIPVGGSTNQSSITLTIGGAGVVSYQYRLDGGGLNGVDLPLSQNIALSGLTDRPHTVAVVGKDAGGNQQPITSATTATWTVKANPPVMTLNPVSTPATRTKVTIGGTVELGSIPSVTLDTSATAGPVTTIGGNGISTWSCVITGLVPGINNITVKALDFVFNTTTKTAAITIVAPDGNFKGKGSVDTSDALRALRIAVGVIAPTPDDLIHGDVAPLVNGVPAPDSSIDVADALVILKKAVGLLNF